jgi:heme exporter protein C
MWKWIKKFSSPQHFYYYCNKFIPWFGWIFGILTAVGLYYGLVIAPIDYQQGESYRIMFIHVPAAWMSMFVYLVMAISGGIGLIWQIKTAFVVAKSSAIIGATFTFIALITGAIWGKPTWGAWWVWDARLTSELILLFLYFAYMALYNAFDNPKTAQKASSILALVGVVNLPIIHYSVKWWNTLHQGASVTKLDAPSIHIDMLIPLLIMTVAFQFLYGLLLFMRSRNEVLILEQNSRWVKDIITDNK